MELADTRKVTGNDTGNPDETLPAVAAAEWFSAIALSCSASAPAIAESWQPGLPDAAGLIRSTSVDPSTAIRSKMSQDNQWTIVVKNSEHLTSERQQSNP